MVMCTRPPLPVLMVGVLRRCPSPERALSGGAPRSGPALGPSQTSFAFDHRCWLVAPKEYTDVHVAHDFMSFLVRSRPCELSRVGRIADFAAC